MNQQAGAHASRPIDLFKLAGLAVELCAILLLIYYFRLESQAFFHVSALAFGGFLVHYFLPPRLQAPFFLLLSVAAIVLVFGWQALWLVGIGLVLIAVCHAPVPLRARVVGLVTLGAVLAALRAGWAPAPWSAAIWPILASMFMFRLILYVYDSSHDSTPASIWQRLSYFFLLPNVSFPLFPVVDYQTFRRTYYNDERHQIYQVGVLWILRGLIQLILYRVVYYYLSMAPTQVEDLGDLARYVVSGFLLYLRISGQFHIIVGMLKLFGFNLPETHHLYFLSTSFTDFWRRINIYWKDFMMKVFFYPAFFRLRKRGEITGLVASTALVFFVTWVLHAYQWFWIRGSYLLSGTDVLFWASLAVLVMLNTVYEMKHGGVRLVGAQTWTVGRVAGLVARTGLTFMAICVLWSLWTSSSIEEWLRVWRTGLGNPTVRDMRLVPAAILAAIGFGVLTLVFAARERTRHQVRRLNFATSFSAVVATVAAVAFVATPELYGRYLPKHVARTTVAVLGSTREVRLSGHDADMLERGYYEDLLSVQNFNTQLWEVLAAWPVDWSRLEDTGALRLTGDFLKQDLVPLQEIHFRNSTLRTNRWGMRDREYELQPADGVHRFAFVGSSHVMGYGVADDQTFEAVTERRLNEERSPSDPVYEALNFAVDGYSPLQELRLLETRVLKFQPATVLFFAHSGAPGRAANYLAEVARTGVAIPYPELREVAARAGVVAGTGRFEAEQRMRPLGNEILRWTYARMVALCRERGALPVWVFLPEVGVPVPRAALNQFAQTASDAGFVTISLADAFDGHDPDAIWFGEWDHHPNAFGHTLLADKLYQQLMKTPAVFAWNRP